MRWKFCDVPEMPFGQTGKRVGVIVMRDFLMSAAPDRVFVELVGAAGFKMKGAIQNNNSFIRSAGFCEAVPLTCGFDVTPITPQRWKKFHGLSGLGENENVKEVSRQHALKKIPEIEEYLQRKKDHGRAETALMALYAEYLLR